MPNKCICFSAQPKVNLHEEFAELREKCVALKKVFLPDDIWSAFQNVTQGEPDQARHQSMLLLAYERGHLHKLTSPVHRYLLDDSDNLGSNVKADYMNDLQEKWIIQKHKELDRHHASRGYRGKLTELLCAEWLEDQDWKISSMEATGGDYDIAAVSTEEEACVFEIKFIGQEDDVFGGFNEEVQHLVRPWGYPRWIWKEDTGI